MFLKKIKIHKYKIFEDLEINFQIPKDSIEKNKNIINIIIGENGSGKTTLLEYIYLYLGGHVKITSNDGMGRQTLTHTLDLETGELFLDKQNLCKTNYHQFYEKILQHKMNKSKIIYFDSNTITKEMVHFMNNQNPFENYKFLNYIDSKMILALSEEYIKKYIITKMMNSDIANHEERRKHIINEFNESFRNTELLSKLYNIDKNHRPVFQTINKELITIDNLSSGEKQLYGRVIALKMLEPENSIILIDEPDLALHPKWQIEIMKIYQNIGKNNQFIVTTHSPFIISQTHYKNFILLIKENNKIVNKSYSQPPLDRDINTIIKTIMGADYFPKKLLDLHKQYRKFFEDEKLDTKEAEDLKFEILEYESGNSSFFQELAFDKELMELE